MRARAGAAAAAALLAAGAVAGCGPGLQDLPVGRTAQGPDYRVTAVFDHADRVVPGTPVRMGQEVIGRVHGLTTDGRTARVALSLRRDVPVPAGASVTIELPSALGNPFLRVTPPAGPAGATGVLGDGDEIPVARTAVGPQIESSLAALGLLLTGSGLDQLRTVLTELDAAYGGRGAQVRELLDDAGSLATDVEAHRDDLERTLAAADAAAGTLAQHQDVLTRALDAAAPTVTVLAGQDDAFGRLLDAGAGIAAQAQGVLDAAGDDLGAEIDGAARVLTALRPFDDTDGPTLRAAGTFAAGFTSAVRGDYLVFDGALDVPESVYELWSGGTPAPLPGAAAPPPGGTR